MIRSLIEDLIRPISGSLGKKIRYWYYRKKLGACGKNLFIDTGVHLVNYKKIRIGDNCWIDKNSVLIAGYTPKDNIIEKKNSMADAIPAPGELSIGNNVHIGLGTVIQGHGGVAIGDYFTSSAYCCIYSLSNDPYRSTRGTVGQVSSLHYVMTPVVIKKNVWLGLRVSVIGAFIENDVFVKANSVVTTAIPSNSVVEGSPAKKIGQRFNG